MGTHNGMCQAPFVREPSRPSPGSRVICRITNVVRRNVLRRISGMPPDASAVRLGQRLRKARLARNYTQSEVAQQQFSVSYISAVERGQIRPSLGALERLSDRLHVPLADSCVMTTILSFRMYRQWTKKGDGRERRNRRPAVVCENPCASGSAPGCARDTAKPADLSSYASPTRRVVMASGL